ncbi:MAG: ISAzo13 family transposase, partial [Kiritimatiellae bacterium]|nr:ISAzo13 family transposase [Kiritimatiellia bacterium]
GLTVTAEANTKTYDLGEDVEKAFENVRILRHPFHPEWNYPIRPRPE